MDRYYYDCEYESCAPRQVRRPKRQKRRSLFPLVFVLCLLLAGLGFIIIQRGKAVAEQMDAGLFFDSILPAITGKDKEDDRDFDENLSPKSISVNLTAKNAYVTSLGAENPLYEKNADTPISPASTAKILTALTALEYCSLDEVVTIGSEIYMMAEDSSRAWLNFGDSLTIEQLLTALLLPSGNDAAFSLSVYTGRKIAGDDSLWEQDANQLFVEAMNAKAKELGANSSNFLTPDGYDAPGQYTTAYDLHILAEAFIKNSILKEIAASYVINDTWYSGQPVTYYNTNELLNPQSAYFYPNTIGLKTGNSSGAGSCLISAAEIDGDVYISVVMNSSSEEERFSDSVTVFNAIEKDI